MGGLCLEKLYHRDVIEMSFWLLSFLEKFEKEFESSQQRIAQGLFISPP